MADLFTEGPDDVFTSASRRASSATTEHDDDAVFVAIARRTVPRDDWDLWDGTSPLLQVREAPSRRGEPEPLVGEVTADATEADILDAFGPGDYYVIARRPRSSEYLIRERVTVGRSQERRERARRFARESAEAPAAGPAVVQLYESQIAEARRQIDRMAAQLEAARGRVEAIQAQAHEAVSKLRDALEAERRARLMDQLKAVQQAASGAQISEDAVRGWIEDAVSNHGEGDGDFSEEVMEEMGKWVQGAQMLKAATGG